MIGKELIEERDVTLSEVKSLLNKRKKAGELSYEQKAAHDYVSEFGKTATADAKKLVEELQKIGKIDGHTAVLIANNAPRDKSDLRVIMEKKRFTMTDDDIKKVLDLVAKYCK